MTPTIPRRIGAKIGGTLDDLARFGDLARCDDSGGVDA